MRGLTKAAHHNIRLPIHHTSKNDQQVVHYSSSSSSSSSPDIPKLTANNPVLLTAALTGDVPTKSRHMKVPITPEEIIQDTCEVGVSLQRMKYFLTHYCT